MVPYCKLELGVSIKMVVWCLVVVEAGAMTGSEL